MNNKTKLIGTILVCLICSSQVSAEVELKQLKGITFSGRVEVEADYSEGFGGGDSSDLVLDKVILGIGVNVHQWVDAYISFLFEEGSTDLEVDEAIITLGNTELSPFYLVAGRMYVPFGNYETHFISDPLTLEIGETRETVVQLGYESKGFYGSIYAFNGDSSKDEDDDHVDQFGANIGYAQEQESLGFDVGMSYINNIADSDAVIDVVADADNLVDYVAGAGMHGILNMGKFSLIAEYISATEAFETATLGFDGSGAEPEAWNLEAVYHFEIAGKEAAAALAYQGTDEALALELPEQRYLAGISVGIFDNTSLALEWAYDKDYDQDKGGTGEDANIVTLQLAAVF